MHDPSMAPLLNAAQVIFGPSGYLQMRRPGNLYSCNVAYKVCVCSVGMSVLQLITAGRVPRIYPFLESIKVYCSQLLLGLLYSLFQHAPERPPKVCAYELHVSYIWSDMQS